MPDEAAVQQFDEERAEAYDERIRRLAPGYDVLQETVASVLSTCLDDEAHLLVVGAGTGAEILTMGQAHLQWQFTAVDPSPEMLDRCRHKVEAAGLGARVHYVCDPVEAMGSDRQFDGATSIFVAHFIDEASARRRFFRAIAERLRSEAPFVWADLFRPTSDAAFHSLWAAWREQMARAGLSADEVERTFDRIEEGISFVRTPDLEDEVTEAGFAPVVQVHQHLLWGAWMARKS